MTESANPAEDSINLHILTNFVNLILDTTKVPTAVQPIFFGARLIPLKKKDGGLRPIAVGNTLRRLVSKIVCNKARGLVNELLPFQYGFGVRQGGEACIHAARRFLTENPTSCLLKIDFKNAFNCVSRAAFLEAIAIHLPGAFNYIKLAYDNPSTLLCQTECLESAEGAQQGDPLGPLLFCLAIHSVIKKLQSPLNVWYLDDGTIGGTATQVFSDFEIVKDESQKI